MAFKTGGKRPLIIVILVAAVIVAVGLALGLVFGLRKDEKSTVGAPPIPLPPSPSPMGVFWDAAVVTNGYPCAIIARDILRRGGSAVDGAIAALFCEGVISLQSMGLGGGFLMTIYLRESQTAITLNARETAPAAATEDMYHGDSNLSQYGGLAVAIPGELKGYREAFERYGSGQVTWEELIQPSIVLCQEGFAVSRYLANILKNNEDKIKRSPTIREIVTNENGEVLKEGEILKRPILAKTLEKIAAANSSDIFYNGELGQQFVDDVREMGGILTEEDLKNYNVRWEDPVTTELSDGTKVFTSPLPGSGPILTLLMNILDGFIPAKTEEATYQRITEAMKYAFARRTELGDPYFLEIDDLINNLTSIDYAAGIREKIQDDRTYQDPSHYGAVFHQPDDHGTAHISLVAPNGDAVSVTSTVNLILGAMARSNKTGIIMNDEMDDFSAPNITNYFGVPPSSNNFIKPGKRPMSSMCPSIFVDKNGDVRLVVGSAGGTKITSSTLLVALSTLWLNQTVKEAVDARRIHHQLLPMELEYEDGFSEDLATKLGAIGHSMTKFAVGGSSVTAILRDQGLLYANADFRRNGIFAGF